MGLNRSASAAFLSCRPLVADLAAHRVANVGVPGGCHDHRCDDLARTRFGRRPGVDPFDRELLAQPTFTEKPDKWHPGPPIVAAIVTSELGVLVGKRRDGKPPWTFIAGEQDAVKDENPADTAVREVKEETGLRIVAGDIIGERDHPATGRHMVYIAARPAPRAGTNVIVGDRDELAVVRWVSLTEAGELLPGMFGPVREHLEREIGGAER